MGGIWYLLPSPGLVTGTSPLALDPSAYSSGGAGAVLHNAEYEVQTSTEVHATRSVGCGGWSEGLPVARSVEHATFQVPEDDKSYPMLVGVVDGAEISCFLKRGQLGEYDLLHRTIVSSIRVMNNQQKARALEVVCSQGQYLRSVPPSLVPTEFIPGA